MIFVIIGMHKSGTTMISETIHKSGINMGVFDSKIGYDYGNQYERLNFFYINTTLLKSSYKYSLDVINSTIFPQDIDKKKVLNLVNVLSSEYKNWGFKDPRTTLCYTFFWKDILPDHKLIFMYRCPVEVASHYTKKSKLIYKINTYFKALKAWYIYNEHCIRIIKETNYDYLILDFNSFINDNKQFSKLEKFTSINLKDSRKKDLYRNKINKNKINIFSNYFMKYRYNMDINSMYQKLLLLSK